MVEKYGITVVPLAVTLDGETVDDGVWTTEEFFERMSATDELPTTSQPSVGAFVEAYERVLKTADQVVSVHISHKLSGTLESARTAAVEFGDKVHIFDTMNLSMGHGLQVIGAAKDAAAGMSVETILERAAIARDRVQLLVGVDSMENMVKGGRLSAPAGRVGAMLNVKLTVETRDGKVVLSRMTRGSKGALQYGLKWVDSRMGNAKRGIFCVMHALAPDRAEWLRQAIEERYEVEELYLTEPGAVIATHTGTGWGIMFLPLD